MCHCPRSLLFSLVFWYSRRETICRQVWFSCKHFVSNIEFLSKVFSQPNLELLTSYVISKTQSDYNLFILYCLLKIWETLETMWINRIRSTGILAAWSRFEDIFSYVELAHLEPNAVPIGFDWYFLCYLLLFILNSLISNLHLSRTIFLLPLVQKYSIYLKQVSKLACWREKKVLQNSETLSLLFRQLIIFAGISSFLRSAQQTASSPYFSSWVRRAAERHRERRHTETLAYRLPSFRAPAFAMSFCGTTNSRGKLGTARSLPVRYLYLF